MWPFVQPSWERMAWSPQSITCRPSSAPLSCARGQCCRCGGCRHLCRGRGQSAHAHARGRKIDAYLDSRDGSGGGNQQGILSLPSVPPSTGFASAVWHSFWRGAVGSWVPAACDALLTALERFRDDDAGGSAPTGGLVLASEGLSSASGPTWPPVTTCRSPSGTIGQIPRAVAYLSGSSMPHGRLPNVGEIWRNPDLARTFTLLLEAERAAASQGRTAGLRARAGRVLSQ